MVINKINILFYPHSWNETFKNKDVLRFPKERLNKFSVVTKYFELFKYIFVKLDTVVIFHISLKNLPIHIFKFFKRFDLEIKADLNYTRTLDLSRARGLRFFLYKQCLIQANKIIIETTWEYEFFKEKIHYWSKLNIEVQHNKVFTQTEFNLIHKLGLEKQNSVLYYLRFKESDESYNYNYGLDVFLKCVELNYNFFIDKEIVLIGRVPESFQNLVKERYGNLKINILGLIDRDELISILCKTKYFINTSRNESYSLLLMEAVICNCLIASTYSGVARDLDLEYIDVEYPLLKFNFVNVNQEDYVYKIE
jgi:hypothetical protein